MPQKRAGTLAKLTAGQLATLASTTTPPTPLIVVPPGGTLVVIVDVGPMSVPYTVSYVGRTLVKALVDRAESVPLVPGDQVLGWAFAHAVKGWQHTIGVSVNDGVPIVLETRSEADKDQDHSVNFAIVRA
jgi:hypothetical protein